MFNKFVAGVLPFMPPQLVWLFSRRYIAGETIDDGLRASRELNRQNMVVTVDLLGEFIQRLDEADAHKNLYFEIIERFTDKGIRGSFSLKPTMFGLHIDPDLCYSYLHEIVRFAASKDRFIRIDMEDSPCVDREIDLFKKLRAEFPGNTGLVLQSYLRRTKDDLKHLSTLNTEENPLNFRLCKGIYVEPERIAYKKPREIQRHFLEDLEFMFAHHMYAAIATHDKFLVDEACRLIEKYEVPKDRYEFQMLFGVTPELRKSIVDKGHLMRVYVPFGKHWFNYSTRRLKENPKMAQHIIKALFVRG